MAAAEVLVDRLVSVWSVRAVRTNVPWMFLLLSASGSILKELRLVPASYFSHSGNALNLYFVKVSWFWTLLLLTPFLVLSNSSLGSSSSYVARRLLSLAVATGVWYVVTETFFYIEDATGACYDAAGAVNQDFSSKAACRRAGLRWHGYDISGHSFILAYSSLLIMEETAPMACVKTVAMAPLSRTALQLLYLALNAILLIWVWMFVCTSVYFHEPSHKLLGTVVGLLAWHLTYCLWYQSPLSPGLPPQRHAKEQKQHA